jgi:mercuric ion transport protein
MQTATKQLWASVLTTVVGPLCCVAPLVLLTLRISGPWISQLAALKPYRPIFNGVMAVSIGLAFRQLYIVRARCAPDEACANRRRATPAAASLLGCRRGARSAHCFPVACAVTVHLEEITMRRFTRRPCRCWGCCSPPESPLPFPRTRLPWQLTI